MYTVVINPLAHCYKQPPLAKSSRSQYTRPGRRNLRPLHGATWEYEGVIAHVWGGENFACQVCDPVTEIIVTRRDEDAPGLFSGNDTRMAGYLIVMHRNLRMR